MKKVLGVAGFVLAVFLVYETAILLGAWVFSALFTEVLG